MQELEKDVEVPLEWTAGRHSGLLEQVPIDRRSRNRSHRIEEDAHKFTLTNTISIQMIESRDENSRSERSCCS